MDFLTQPQLRQHLVRTFVPDTSRSRPKRLCTRLETSATAEVTKQVPYWIGKTGPVSQAINAAIDQPAIWSIMRMGARNAMIKTAEKSGIPWKQTVAELQSCGQLEQLRQQLTDPGLVYPEYAKLKFHAYDDGNLDWQAVYEVEPATAATAVRVFRHDNMGPDEATTTMRQNFAHNVQPRDSQQHLERRPRQPLLASGQVCLHNQDMTRHDVRNLEAALSGCLPEASCDFEAFCEQHGVEVHRAIDAGCAGGESTRWLAHTFPAAHVTGVDISAHFLALAELRRRQADPASAAAAVEYMHASAECLPLEDHCLDLFAGSYLLHELPAAATFDLLREAHRVLRPGGVVAVIDGDPWSEVHQKMPLPLATLMKSTEPYLDEYFSLDLEAALHSAGFKRIDYQPVNHRHRLLIATS